MLTKPGAIPRASGCYLFRNERGTVIYVGKARSLTQRLSSYFQRREALSPKTQALMEEATSVEWIVTPSEVDALILENELIKENQPHYNLRLKDDKTYPYVAIDARTPFPVPYVTRSQHVSGVRYFGPFVEVRALRATMDELLQVYPLRTCSRHKYDYQRRIQRPCLLYDIGKCSGPCVGAIDPDGYAALVESWAKFFEGEVRPLRRTLETRMAEASANQHYEAAARLRDGLAALARASNDQVIVLDDHTNLDAVAVRIAGNRAGVVRFRIRHGRIIGRQVHFVDRALDESPAEVLESVLASLFADPLDVPREVITNVDADSTLVRAFLSERRGSAVSVMTPQRGRRRRVLDMAEADADAVMERDSHRREFDYNVRSRALQEIGAALGLARPPFRIECFDMSHLQGTNYVGSMVVFEDGVAKKSDYRRFHVRETVGNDDVGAMFEVVRRRLGHWGETSDGTAFREPDLIVIDGGLPQLHAAMRAAEAVGLLGQVEFTALAKREELLYRPDAANPIMLERGSESLYLVQRIRDEAHRFAITFHRSKRGKAMVATSLEGVAGLGPQRRSRLLLECGSLDNLRAMTLEELLAIRWLPDEVARNLYDHLRAPTVRRPSKETTDDG